MFHFFDVTQNLYETMRVHFPRNGHVYEVSFRPQLDFFASCFNHPREVDLFIPILKCQVYTIY